MPYSLNSGGRIQKLFLLVFLVIPVSVMLVTESCTQMKSATGDNNGLFSSAENVCADVYQPTINFNAKSEQENYFTFPFEDKKVHLESLLQSKAVADLQNQSVIVVIDRQCTPRLQSLSDLVLKAQEKDIPSLDRVALPWTITEAWDFSTLETKAEEDPCVLGLTLPGTLRTAALPLPATNDTALQRQNHLAFTNYKHAYDHLVRRQSASFRALVAILDTGVDCNHSDLRSQLVSNCGDNMISPTLPPTDEAIGHGTHVAGLLGAVSNNALGIAGMGGASVRLHPIKIIGADGGTIQDAYDAIQRAILLNADVINLSVQSDEQLPLIEQGVGEAVRAGIVVVMAAGNYGELLGGTRITSPAMVGSTLNGALTVGSLDTSSGKLSTFSNFGDRVEIATAGAISSLSADVTGGLYSLGPNNSYQRLMGTSQATPIVAAAAALVIQFLKQNQVTYTPADIERIVVHSADSIPNLQVRNGRALNFSKLVRNAYAFAGLDLCQNGQPR